MLSFKGLAHSNWRRCYILQRRMWLMRSFRASFLLIIAIKKIKINLVSLLDHRLELDL